jgi:hypothetical protein
MMENEEDESVSMQIDEEPLDAENKKKASKAKPAKKTSLKTNENTKDENSLASEIKKGKRSRKKKEPNDDAEADDIKQKSAAKGTKEKNIKNKKENNGDNNDNKDNDKKPKKEKKEKVAKDALDLTYDIDKNYFYQNLNKEELNQLQEYFENYFLNAKAFDENKEYLELKSFLDKYPNLRKGDFNIDKLNKM